MVRALGTIPALDSVEFPHETCSQRGVMLLDASRSPLTPVQLVEALHVRAAPVEHTLALEAA